MTMYFHLKMPKNIGPRVLIYAPSLDTLLLVPEVTVEGPSLSRNQHPILEVNFKCEARSCSVKV
jgi:hypothetical protein